MRRATDCLLFWMLLACAPEAIAQSADSVVGQMERRAAAGDRVGARALADSLLSVLPPESMHVADALYWRAVTATNAADAERDYLRLAIEYPLSPRVAVSLLNLAQLEFARRDVASARRHFEQLLREHPASPFVAKASYWSARLAFDDGDVAHACASLARARAAVAADDVELLNQIEYYAERCAAPAVSDTASPTPSDSLARNAVRDSSRTIAPRREYSVQVASFTRKADAAALAAQLRRRGLPGRVVGNVPPFRVRIGRYDSRDAAETTLSRVKQGNPRAIIVEAEAR